MTKKNKFRGLDKRGEWHYGFYWESPNGIAYIKERINEYHSADFEVKKETVGQFINSTDKNNVEIYEDDIVKLYEYKDIIEKIVFKNREFNVDGQFFFNPEKSEVISNAHQNPELLKKIEN